MTVNVERVETDCCDRCAETHGRGDVRTVEVEDPRNTIEVDSDVRCAVCGAVCGVSCVTHGVLTLISVASTLYYVVLRDSWRAGDSVCGFNSVY